jgi:hypothetical protein
MVSVLRRIKGMQIDEGDALLLEPVPDRIIGYAFRLPIRPVMD